MKNLILGMIGGAAAIYLIVFCLSIYSISARENEIENCISQVMEQSLRNYYGENSNNEEIRKAVTQDLIARLQSDSRIVIDVHTCDMQQGILSVIIKEEFYLPMGGCKTITCKKTIIAEEVEEESTQDLIPETQ